MRNNKKKIIQFLLPGAGIAGGVKVVFQYANYLAEQGHTVRLYYPGVREPRSSVFWRYESFLRAVKYRGERLIGINEARTWFPLTPPLYHIPSLETRYIPPADITIATGNETADWTALLPPNRGEKFYFIQDVETWGKRSDEAVMATWKLPLRKITISSTLAAVATRLHEPIEAVITNGIDLKTFYNNHKHYNTPPRLLMLSHYDERKGIPDGLAALELVRQRYPTVQVRMFGAQPPRPDMPADYEYFYQPTTATLRELYSTSDVFLSPSWAEGCQLPPMEAMACACAVVATNVGGIPDYAIANQTVLVVPPRQPDQLAAAVVRLLADRAFLERISLAGQRHIQQFTFEKAAQRFEQAILAPPAASAREESVEDRLG